jgi:hypothetical protein
MRARPDREAEDDNDDDADRPRKKKAAKKSNTGLIVGLVIGGSLLVLLVCGGTVAGVLYMVLKQDQPQVAKLPFDPKNPPPIQNFPPPNDKAPPTNPPPKNNNPPPPMAKGKVGSPAPEIEAEDLDGKNFKLSDYRGKVVLLDFWGHW